MSASTPWSVKSVEPKAREIAKDLARRSGMTLGEWLNTLILEIDETEEAVSGQGTETGHEGAPEIRSVHEMARLVATINAIVAKRLEATERGSTDALKNVDEAVARLAHRIEQTERRLDGGEKSEDGVGMTGPSREEIDARFREMEARAEVREVALNAKLDRITDKLGQLSDHVIGARKAAEEATKATIVTRWNVIAIAISAVVGIVAIVLATNALMISTAQLAAGVPTPPSQPAPSDAVTPVG